MPTILSIFHYKHSNSGYKRSDVRTPYTGPSLGKLVTKKTVDFVGFDNVVEFNKNRQNDDNVVKAYKS